MYSSITSGPTNRLVLTRRLGGVVVTQSGGIADPINKLISVTGVWAGGGTRGIYLDGALDTVGSIAAPTATITRIQLAGYNGTKMPGYLYDWVLYDAALSLAQIEEVRDYLRDRWNSGAPF